MNSIFTDYLFEKHLLVSTSDDTSASFETLFSLANLFGIRIVSGAHLAQPQMLRTAEQCIGYKVPAPFYRGFPQSVRALSSDARLFDQLLHYYRTYGCGDFTAGGGSVMEADFERLAFAESTEIKDFSILTEQEAVVKLAQLVEGLLASTRPLSLEQYALVLTYIREYAYKVTNCASKDTAVQLLLDTRDLAFAAFLQLSDVIRVLDRMNYQTYNSENLKKLNLKNRDRKFLTQVIRTVFREGQCNIADCFEKKKIWNGLLHHIHYQPANETEAQFVQAIRGKENLSVYSQFEKHMQQGEIPEAVEVLRKGKGSGALLRNLNYILSRCRTQEDVSAVLQNLHTDKPLIVMQLLLDYSQHKTADRRIFKFTRHNLLRIHKEKEEEVARRRSVVPEEVRATVVGLLRKNLERIYRGKLRKVYIAPGMEKMAIPLQETTGATGFGVMPTGSHLPIKAGKKIRCFTYWEGVNDIDLSVIAMMQDGGQVEFSWRTMYGVISNGITFSGDVTNGYCGASEYFDVDTEALLEDYPDTRYLVFCNNVYSGTPFHECLCKAGYMDRDVSDTGEIFEPKTVTTAFRINCRSTQAYLFAVDVRTWEMIWLNIACNSEKQVAGENSLEFLKVYFHMDQELNLHKLFTMMASQVVQTPEEADVVVTNEQISVAEGVEVIHPYDTERILALMNG